MLKNNSIQKVLKTQRDFSYKKGEINLSFKLDIDTKNSLLDFKDLLVEATKDVEECLAMFTDIGK